MAFYLAVGRPESSLMVRKGSAVRVRCWALERGGLKGGAAPKMEPLPRSSGARTMPSRRSLG
jgi:hypothetical protein